MPDLYDLALEITDKFGGPGSYARLHANNPDPGIQAAIRRSQAKMKCEHCDEEHETVFVHSRCHPEIPTWVEWNPSHESLVVRCGDRRCDKVIVKFEGAKVVP